MKFNVKPHFRFLLRCALGVFICSVVGIVLLVLVYLIPTQKIDSNVRQSAQEFFDYSAVKWAVGGNTDSIHLDNYTDSWILLESVYDARSDENSVLQNALAVKNSTIEKLSYSKNPMFLSHYLENTPFDGTETYSRYWHGYLILIKPLFFFISYADFRILNMIVQLMLLAVFIALLIKRKLYYFLLPYIISYLFLKPAELFLSMQFSSCYYIYTISCIALLLFGKSITEKQLCMVFLYTGVALAYFDFLTYPIATFGVPAVLFFVLTQTSSLKKALSDFLGMALCWGFGYGLMWFLKWLWASIILKENILFDAYDNIMYRTAHESFSKLETLKNNLDNFFNSPFTVILIVFLILQLIVLVITFCRSDKKFTNLSPIFLPFIVLSILPFLWYTVVTNHSYLHAWFTYRILIVLPFAISCMLAKLTLHFHAQKKSDK